jgi:hypothetical protein
LLPRLQTAIIGNSAKELADVISELLDLFARSLCVVEPIDDLRAVFELFAQIRECTLELAQLTGKLIICRPQLLRRLFRLREHSRHRRREQYRQQYGPQRGGRSGGNYANRHDQEPQLRTGCRA